MTAIAMVPVSRRVGGPVPKRVKRRDQDGDTQRLNDPLRLTCYTFGADVMGTAWQPPPLHHLAARAPGNPGADARRRRMCLSTSARGGCRATV